MILVNSRSSHDHDRSGLADATYVEPVVPEIVAKVIERERPDACLPTMGGQTALNVAQALAEDGTFERYGVELIGASREAIAMAEDRQLFRGDAPDQAEMPRSAVVRSLWPSAGRPGRGRPAGDHPAELHARRHRRRHRLQPEEFEQVVATGLDASPIRGADRAVRARLERVRDGGGPRPGGQLHHRVLDRERRPDGRAYRRQHHGRAGADAHRQGISAHARASIAVLREIGVDTGGSNVQFAIDPSDGRMVIIEMNPRVSRSSALASKATGFPIAKVAARLAVGYTLDEITNDITGARRRRSSRRSITWSPRCRGSRSRSSRRPSRS